jgi:uncharacterized membrane protein YphA (DoxX/SURF4 family)
MTTLRTVDEPETPTFDIGAWVLRTSAGLVFLGLGYVKMFPGEQSMWFHTFDAIGFGRWFMTFTGAMQATGGFLLLFPRTTLYGGVVAGATMVGAMIAQATVLGEPSAAIIPGAVLALLIAVTFRARA